MQITQMNINILQVDIFMFIALMFIVRWSIYLE